ncbi:MAG: S24 family peptidase [Acidimicrobiales bacterium]
MTEDPSITAKLLRDRLDAGAIDLRVAGTSMGTDIPTGSIVSLTPARRPRVGEIWAFVADDTTIVVHRLRSVDRAQVTGRGTANRVDDQPIPRDRLIGRVRASRPPTGPPRRFGAPDRVRNALLLRARGMACSARPAAGWPAPSSVRNLAVVT